MSAPINLLARGYRVEVSADGATNWLRPGGLNDFNAPITPNKVASDNYDSNGWSSFEITMQSWVATLKFNRQATSGVEDPASVLIRSCQGQFGDAARLYIRWYRKDGLAEAWSGRAIVEVNPSKTGVADLNELTAVFTGDGILTPITNPYAPTAVPSILSATPSGVAAGGLVRIVGANFLGTVPSTGVKFAAVAATSWDVVSDSLIEAVMPAGSAGSAPITVTNATGVSASFPYTRA